MEEFTGGDVYQKEFNPRSYLEYYKFGEGTLGDETTIFYLECLCKTFALGSMKGDTLIDIGSGPTIYQLISACEAFETIIASDYLDENLQETRKWLKNEPGAFDWSPVVKYVCELEGNRDKWAEKEAKLRRSIKQVLKCNVHLGNPMAPLSLPQVDCVLSSECLEAACSDHESYRTAVKNISSLLKPGGHLVLCGVLETTFYMVGSRKFSSLFLTEKFLREALTANGFTIVQFKTQPRVDKVMLDMCDFTALYFIVACKGTKA
ncbi:nicotinamide N-methyltransferase-like [Sceloporus undulatus]|uniref:nicotinamide N-methyltransferase-like n=1 Tax=Sceloporus undulatus TaxID=8520 RepID=UPI001C4ABD83|nr:nicotinamide N-methyltransferase-like [Sceloporus undulatus]